MPEELTRRYLDGASLDDLGVLCGCTATRIQRVLVAQGVEIRPRRHNHGNGRGRMKIRVESRDCREFGGAVLAGYDRPSV